MTYYTGSIIEFSVQELFSTLSHDGVLSTPYSILGANTYTGPYSKLLKFLSSITLCVCVELNG